MLRKFFEKLHAAFRAEMEGIAEEQPDSFERLNARLACILKYLRLLREHALKHGFKEESDEIYCFKEAKPELASWYIYHTEWHHIECRIPAGSAEVINHYFLEEIRMLDRNLDLLAFFVRYRRMKATELDHLGFVRGRRLDSILLPDLRDTDPEFSTCVDPVFARIMAYERLRERLLEEVRLPDMGVQGIDMRWTGDACNLVEVIYGIFDTGQLNYGKAELQDIANLFSEIFRVKLDRFYRRFTEIKERKILAPTNFLDQMRASILKRVEDDLSLRPKRKRP